MHCRRSSTVIGLAILCLLMTGVLGEKTEPIEGTLDFIPDPEAGLLMGSEMEENATLPVASEMKEDSTLAVKIDGTSLSSHTTPVEKTNIRSIRSIRDLIDAGLLLIRDQQPPATSHQPPAATRKKQVRRSRTLSAGEQQYIVEREKIVREALSNLKIGCSALESVPRVALLGSGGGERASVSLMGSLSQMQTDGLLDTMLYLGGVSGSTWSMASLYSDPMWSKNMSSAVSSLWGPPVGLEESWLEMSWLAKRSQAEDFSLSDLWAVMTSATIQKHMDLRHLSKEAERPALNPYPVYNAINKNCKQAGPLGFKGTWFEVTPHESGYTELGLFFNTSLLGCRRTMSHEDNPESEIDMVQLQAMMSSALGDEQSFPSVMPDEFKDAVGRTLTDEDNLMDLALLWMNGPKRVDNAWDAANMYMYIQHTIAKLSVIMRRRNETMDDPTVRSQLDSMEEAFKETMNAKPVAWLEFQKRSPEQRKEQFDSWSAAIIKPMEEWSQSLETGPLKDFVNWSVKKLFPVIGRWEWGTTANLLYTDYSAPRCVRKNKHIQLIDAGTTLQMPYPPFLGDKRDIDLIIAMDYSQVEAFKSLTNARDYAAKVNKPFPEIDDRILEQKDWPNNCYVFQGEQYEPTIIYMPLFNRNNCRDAEEIKQKMEEYSFIHMPYTREKVESLVEMSANNMKTCKDIILKELRRIVEQKGYRA